MADVIDAAGTRICYEIWGEQHGETLILLHGLGSAGLLWQPQIPALSQEYRVISFDYPGHGCSDAASTYSIEQLVTVLESVMDHCQVAKAHLMGLSLGCAVALSFAARHPERVASLILQGPVGGVTPRYHFGWFVQLALLRVYLLLLYLVACLTGRERAVHLVNCYGYQTYDVYRFLEAIQCRAQPKAIWQLAQDLAYPPYVGYLENVTCPAIMVVGSGDITPHRYWDYIVSHLGGGCNVVKVQGARHIVSVEQPEQYSRLVLAFLKAQHHRSRVRKPLRSATRYRCVLKASWAR